MRAMPKTKSDPASPRLPRSDGLEARTRLLHQALRLFAEQGFAKTSTREIASAAGANIAAISYYFGDKAGLYRAAFVEPLGSPKNDIPLYHPEHLSLRQSLEGLFGGFLEPLQRGEVVQQCMKLHFREMLEPTGLWAEELEHGIKPAHAALVDVLRRHLGLTRADDELHRLAFSITAMALQLYMCPDVIREIRPALMKGAGAPALWVQRLADFAESMVAGEAQRRRTTASPETTLRKKTPT